MYRKLEASLRFKVVQRALCKHLEEKEQRTKFYFKSRLELQEQDNVSEQIILSSA